MKNNRQSMILDIIAKEHIETQEQLLEQLRQRGVASTQATISRDIKQLHLVKEPTGHGTYKYAVSSSRARLNIADKLRTIFHESITSVDCAQNIVVFKTLAGLAGGALRGPGPHGRQRHGGHAGRGEHGLRGHEGQRLCGDLLPGDPGNAVNHRQKPILKGDAEHAGIASH